MKTVCCKATPVRRYCHVNYCDTRNYASKSSLHMISCYSAPVSLVSPLVSPSNSIRFLDFKLPHSKRGLSRGPVLTTLIRRGPSACWKVYGADNELSNDNFWTDAGPHYFDLTASQCQLKEDLYRNGKRERKNTHGSYTGTCNIIQGELIHPRINIIQDA